MGAINFSIDPSLIQLFARELPLKIFAETGTFKGESLRTALRFFKECHSVELSPEYHAAAVKNFESYGGAHLHLGESPAWLRKERERFAATPTLFWLDAHWCAAKQTAGENAQSPLLDELDAIGSLNPESVVLIDDARLYLSPPPAPHRASDWPDFHSIVQSLLRLSSNHRLMVLNDVLVFYPSGLQSRLAQFAYDYGVDWLHLANVAGDQLQKKKTFPTAPPATPFFSPSNMTRLPSIGVLIPTFNCVELIAGHVESLNSWIDLAAEVVVVDSESKDGTMEFLKKNLRHPNVRFLQHPRGLYQSWNFGIRNLTADYTYISTVGDSISREGLQYLRQIAVEHQCDVVASKPRFVDNDGLDQPDMLWPIDDVRGHFPGHEPLVLEGFELLLLALRNGTSAILGSSASNLYRTKCLQERPFPTDYGTVGDGAWGLINCYAVRMAFTGKIFSTFRDHPKAYPRSDYFVESLNVKLFRLACERYLNYVKQSKERREQARVANVDLVMRTLSQHLACQWRLEKYREMKFFPWILNPLAWYARHRRDRLDRRVNRLMAQALEKIRSRGPAPLQEKLQTCA